MNVEKPRRSGARPTLYFRLAIGTGGAELGRDGKVADIGVPDADFQAAAAHFGQKERSYDRDRLDERLRFRSDGGKTPAAVKDL